MTKQELIKLIKQDLSVSDSLEIDLNDKEIDRIIEQEKKHVHRDWRDAVELKYAVMYPEAFRTPEYKKSRTIQFPDCVFGIDEFREIKDGSRMFGINDPDLNLDRIMGSDLWLSPFSSDVITSRTISYSWYDLARSFTLIDIRFKFNINTHRMQVIGHEPYSPVLVRAFVAIDDGDLYEDYYFQRWVTAKCKLSINRILKTFETTLIGGVSISTIFKEEGDKEIESIEAYIKENDKPDWFIMIN